MTALIDTHALLWWLSDDGRLSDRARELLEQSGRAIVSAVSIWEIAIKRAIGKLNAPPDLLDLLEGADVDLLTISARHAHASGDLPLHHRDPFARLIVAQAQLEALPVVTVDPTFARYGVATVW